MNKVIKPKNDKREMTVDDLYDEIYLKNNPREGLKSSSGNQKYLKSNMHKENQEFKINPILSVSKNKNKSDSLKYFHPFLADD